MNPMKHVFSGLIFTKWYACAALLLFALGVLAVTTGCASLSINDPNNELAQKIGAQGITVATIKHFPGHEAEAAAQIRSMAEQMQTFLNNGPNLTLTAFNAALQAKVDALKLDPGAALIAQTLIVGLETTYQRQIDLGQIMTPETRFNISKIAGWVVEVAKLYENAPTPISSGAQNNAIPESSAVG